MKRLILLFCIISLSASASQEQMMSIINKKAEISAKDFRDVADKLKDELGTVCKWDITEEERLFIESSYY